MSLFAAGFSCLGAAFFDAGAGFSRLILGEGGSFAVCFRGGSPVPLCAGFSCRYVAFFDVVAGSSRLNMDIGGSFVVCFRGESPALFFEGGSLRLFEVSALGESHAGPVSALGESRAGVVGGISLSSTVNCTRFFLLHLFTLASLFDGTDWLESARFRVMAPTASASAADTIVSLSKSGVTRHSMMAVLPL